MTRAQLIQELHHVRAERDPKRLTQVIDALLDYFEAEEEGDDFCTKALEEGVEP